MRFLFTIPHYFDPQGDNQHGSLRKDPQPRILALKCCLSALHQLFGSAQNGFNFDEARILEANQCQHDEIDIVICTVGDFHILDRLQISPHLYKHHTTNANPRLLGFECQAILAEYIGQYDYYCFLEDDLILHDPWFFAKLTWFTQRAGDLSLLQPNRYELLVDKLVRKVYIDGELGEDFIPEVHKARETLEMGDRYAGKVLSLQKASNPHSGCYFLNSVQMAYWKSQPYFLDRATYFVGPLESAATLGIMRTFKIYKPVIQNANFLEVQHFGTAISRKIFGVIGNMQAE